MSELTMSLLSCSLILRPLMLCIGHQTSISSRSKLALADIGSDTKIGLSCCAHLLTICGKSPGAAALRHQQRSP